MHTKLISILALIKDRMWTYRAPRLVYAYAASEIEKLRSKAVAASALSSDTPKEEKNEVSVHQNLFRPWPHAKHRFWQIYYLGSRLPSFYTVRVMDWSRLSGAENSQVTPERLCTKDFISLLQKPYENGKINRLIVDEVRSPRWGSSFIDALPRRIASL